MSCNVANMSFQAFQKKKKKDSLSLKPGDKSAHARLIRDRRLFPNLRRRGSQILH